MQRRVNRTAGYLRLMLLIAVVFTISCLITQMCFVRARDQLSQLTYQRLCSVNELDALDQELKYVRSDKYVERVARDEFGLIMPGEIRYVTK